MDGKNHVKDTAKAILNALEKERYGDVKVLCNYLKKQMKSYGLLK